MQTMTEVAPQMGGHNVSDTNSILVAANTYRAEGWPVIPCYPSGPRAKAPYNAGGIRKATLDAEQVRKWWNQWPDALLGIAIPPGIVVLDLDTPGALADLERLNGGPLPVTRTVRTGRGTHLYYRHDAAPESLSQGGPYWPNGERVFGVDVRVGGKGHLIAPPSIHPVAGKPYTWDNPACALAELPAPLADAIRLQIPRPLPVDTGTPGTCAGLLRTVANSSEGERNACLFWAACCMARRSKAGQSTDWEGLETAALNAGLTASETQRTITSALNTVGRAAA